MITKLHITSTPYVQAYGETCEYVSELLDEMNEPCFVQGEVIAESDDVRILQVLKHNIPEGVFIVSCDEIKSGVSHLSFRFPDTKFISGISYYCEEIKSGVSLFCHNELGSVIDALFDGAGNFYGYDTQVNWDIQSESAESETPNVVLLLPESEIESVDESICESGDLFKPYHDENEPCVNDEEGMNRGLRWFSECACAILTTWRGDKSRTENDNNNKELVSTLRNHGFGVTKVRGCYTEEGRLAGRENSFLIFNLPQLDTFYDIIKKLSIHYEQDCFLYKEPGALSRAILVATNNKAKFDILQLGQLHINKMDSKEYTEMGSGRISF